MKLMSVISAILLLCPFTLIYGQTCKGSGVDLATNRLILPLTSLGTSQSGFCWLVLRLYSS